MYFLIAGAVLFFVTHLYARFRSRDTARDIKLQMGTMKYMALYSLVSGLGFGLMIWGFDLARPAKQIYTPPAWGLPLNMSLMLPAMILLFAAYGPRGYIKQFTKHPFLLSIMLWSVGHLFANGELNAIILFGSFLVYALIDRLAVIGRPETIKKPSIIGDIYALVLGFGVYYLLVKNLHELTIGVPVLAGT